MSPANRRLGVRKAMARWNNLKQTPFLQDGQGRAQGGPADLQALTQQAFAGKPINPRSAAQTLGQQVGDLLHQRFPAEKPRAGNSAVFLRDLICFHSTPFQNYFCHKKAQETQKLNIL